MKHIKLFENFFSKAKKVKTKSDEESLEFRKHLIGEIDRLSMKTRIHDIPRDLDNCSTDELDKIVRKLLSKV